MAGSTDLIGAFRAYAQKALGNDFNPEKAAAALNSWVKESGDALKIRVERETEKAVKKLGLAKESELRALQAQVAELQKALGVKSGAKKSSAKSASKKAPNKSPNKAPNRSPKKAARKMSKNSSAKKTSVKKTGSKKKKSSEAAK